MIKNVEWRPSPIVNLTAAPQHTYGPNCIPKVVAALDAATPHWNHKTVENSESSAAGIVNTAATGIMDIGKRKVERGLKDAVETGLAALPAMALALL